MIDVLANYNFVFFFQAEDGIRDWSVTGVQTCALPIFPYAAEVVVIDDGSRDGTAEALRELAAKHAFVRVITHRSQRGIADALRSGADAARGRVLVFYPADLQYSPADIPGPVAPILDGDAASATRPE